MTRAIALLRAGWALVREGLGGWRGWPCAHGKPDPMACDECWSERGL